MAISWSVTLRIFHIPTQTASRFFGALFGEKRDTKDLEK
jgi:hypothetical protein